MMEIQKGTFLLKARFVKSALWPDQYPKLHMHEVAVVGRSNVGKSSLLNDLFQTKRLVKTSSTPGKTQLINFFIVDDRLVFVDLPGYGYAKVPLQVRKQWGPIVQTYLDKRKTLKLLLFPFDIRRTPKHEDKQLLKWAAYYRKPVIIVLTKVDKVNQKEKKENTKKILEAFGVENIPYVHYSVKKNIGRKILISMMKRILGETTWED